MHTIRLPTVLVLTAWLVTGCSQPSLPERGKVAPPTKITVVDMKPVRHQGLVEAIKAQKGKIVVMDVWGEF